jgi:signal transduction histidine kinase
MATIVVVDDSPTDRRLVETVLGYQGHRVLAAGDAPQGLELVRRERPDLLISDILLPSMDGYELVRRLRRDPKVGATRVIFHSAHYLEGEVRRLAGDCGVRHILTKPCEPEKLAATVAELLVAEPAPAAPPTTKLESETVRADHLRMLSAKLYEKVAALERVDEERRQLQARLRELLERTTAAQEQERRRIAADVHDDTIQVIAAVGFQVEALRAQIADEAPRRLIDEIARTVQTAGARLRALVFDLRPPALDLKGGLAAAIREYLEKTPSGSRLPFEVRGQAPGLTRAEVRLLLYRIAQEALINVHKHARAGRVDVEIGEVDGGVRVSVTDDGQGMDPSRLESVSGHLGVTAMRERAEMAGGWWRCESVPGTGTRVEFWVPL